MRATLLTALLFLSAPAFAEDPPAVEEAAEAPSIESEEVAEEAPAEEAAEAPAEEPEKKVELEAVKVPESDEEAIKDVQEAVNALQTGQWATLAILLVGLLVFVWNRFMGSSSSEAPKSDS